MIEFPNLFSGTISVDRIAFRLVNIDVYWYGIMITIGVVLGFLYAVRRAGRFGMISDHVFDVAFVGAVCGFIGARAYFVIFHNLNPDNTFKYTLWTAITGIRDGGLAIYGGIIAAVLGAAIYAKIKKIHILPILDLAGLGFLIGQGVGRWGNFFNQEAYGAPTAGGLPWGMTGDVIAANPDVIAAQEALGGGEYALVHPCFLYEFLWCALGFLLLHFYSRKRRSFDGEIFLLYAAWYGLGRGFIESLRMDSLYAGSLRVSQVIGFASCAFAVILFVYLKIATKKHSTYKMYSETDESREALASHSKNLILEREKTSAKRALRLAEKESLNKAPSILGEEKEGDDGRSD